MNDTEKCQHIIELIKSMKDSPYNKQLGRALNSINSLYPVHIKSDTIDKGVDSYKNLLHLMISVTSSHSEECKEVEKSACTVFAESLKSGYKDLFRCHGLLIE